MVSVLVLTPPGSAWRPAAGAAWRPVPGGPQLVPIRRVVDLTLGARGGFSKKKALPAGLIEWGCDEALWERVSNKKGLLDLLRKGGDNERQILYHGRHLTTRAHAHGWRGR